MSIFSVITQAAMILVAGTLLCFIIRNRKNGIKIGFVLLGIVGALLAMLISTSKLVVTLLGITLLLAALGSLLIAQQVLR